MRLGVLAMPSAMRLPVNEQLPLTTKEKLTAADEGEWLVLCEAMRLDIIESYGSVRAVAELFDYEETQLSRVLSGKGNPPGWLVAFVIWRCKGRHAIRAMAALARGTYEPLPEPTEADEALAVVRALRERGMYDVARKWAGLTPREDAP